ncbi:MAG: phosphoribosylformylglycinamidine synthase II, partial [Alphaproteobacteria bacterium]|nr:phosphoribosylformylglycinamidine synthase II [Alphaproteobacteria bacterium]
CSAYLRDVLGRAGDEAGPPPPVDLAAERRNGECVRSLIGRGLVAACHDLSDGGLLVAAAEMALASRCGCALTLADAGAGALFGEDQGRYLLATGRADEVLERARAAGVAAVAVGRTGGDALTVNGGAPISLDDLRAAHEGWLPAFADAIA